MNVLFASGSVVVKVPISVELLTFSSTLLLLNVKFVGGSFTSFTVIMKLFTILFDPSFDVTSIVYVVCVS